MWEANKEHTVYTILKTVYFSNTLPQLLCNYEQKWNHDILSQLLLDIYWKFRFIVLLYIKFDLGFHYLLIWDLISLPSNPITILTPFFLLLLAGGRRGEGSQKNVKCCKIVLNRQNWQKLWQQRKGQVQNSELEESINIFFCIMGKIANISCHWNFFGLPSKDQYRPSEKITQWWQ
jgi:hypothetical protein